MDDSNPGPPAKNGNTFADLRAEVFDLSVLCRDADSVRYPPATTRRIHPLPDSDTIRRERGPHKPIARRKSESAFPDFPPDPELPRLKSRSGTGYRGELADTADAVVDQQNDSPTRPGRRPSPHASRIRSRAHGAGH
jgi:hypothetical protein